MPDKNDLPDTNDLPDKNDLPDENDPIRTALKEPGRTFINQKVYTIIAILLYYAILYYTPYIREGLGSARFSKSFSTAVYATHQK